jgi:LPXTG-motif cell wall-anchored protein
MRAMLTRTAASAAVAVAVPVLAAGPATAQDDPPGNNGTVKIDGVEFDEHPDNEPHVGCVFQVDFYGFDQGDLQATVTFEAIPPTGDAVLVEDDEVDIGEDEAGGGVDLDASQTYDLTEALAGIEPHPMQGWHVRLTVHAEGSIGADTKFKTFWVTGCESPTTTTTTPGSTTTTTKPGSTTTSTAPTSTTAPGSTTTESIPPGGSTTIPGGAPPVPPGGDGAPPPSAAPGALPRTGGDSLPLAATAAGLVVLGGAGVLAARRLRAAGD